MQDSLSAFLRCQGTHSSLTVNVIKKPKKILDNLETDLINDSVLFAREGWFYKRNFKNVEITINKQFGFNIAGAQI